MKGYDETEVMLLVRDILQLDRTDDPIRCLLAALVVSKMAVQPLSLEQTVAAIHHSQRLFEALLATRDKPEQN